MPNKKRPRPWWKLGPLAWFGIALLILVNVAIFTDWLTVDRQTISWIVYSLNPFAWPLWVATLLWCAVLWMAGDRRIGGERFRSIHRFLKPMAVVLGVLLLLYQNEAHLATQRTRWYNAVYLEYTVGPLSRLMLDGYWDWKTFVLPAFGVLAIGGLVILARRLRKRNRGGQNG